MIGSRHLQNDIRAWLSNAGTLTVYALRRFEKDRCLRVAASLSYTTLLALVPLLTIGFAMFSAFPAFKNLQAQLQDMLFRNLVPELGSVIQEQFTTFVQNTGELTSIGIVVLAVTALMMFVTVETAFNAIWRVAESRSLIARLLVFWAVLTIGPLLMGASLTLSTYMFTLTRMLDIEVFTGPLGGLVRLLPFLLEITVFSLLYMVVPNRSVRWTHALIGGLTAALLFELLKKGFALYIANFPAQQTIYGALSTIPLFLVWMYVSWAAALVGAEIAASLPEYRHRAQSADASRRSRYLYLALGILAGLADAARRGEGGLNLPDRATGNAGDPALYEDVLAGLHKAHYVERTDDGAWVLGRDLHLTTLFDLYKTLGFAIDSEEAAMAVSATWRRQLAKVLSDVNDAQNDIMGVPLGVLLAPPEQRQTDPAARNPAPLKERGPRTLQ